MSVRGSQKIKDYYKRLADDVDIAYGAANAARAKGLDPEDCVEMPLAQDICDRVEGLVGPKGIAKPMREYLQDHTREETAIEAIDWIVSGRFGTWDKNTTAEQCVRTSLALMTEAVVAAPIEGMSKTVIGENPDGSSYLTLYFAGPIRAAGGTSAALTVLFADYIRRKLELGDYRPTETEVERYVEEITIYHNAVSRLQYNPTDDEIRLIVRNCPVCVSGDPTSELEVDVHKDIQRIETNRIRGGMALVIGEGIAQKAAKIVKYAKGFGLDWSWLQGCIKESKQEEGKTELKPIGKYMKDVVAGRPIIAYPMRKGGFRLRYGRSRNTGLMAKGIHPATMVALDGFPAIGTQFKVERPGKGMVVVPVDPIRGPTVKLKNGTVKELRTTAEAAELLPQIEEILFIGDLLVSFGDFLKSNHPITPSAWVEEWWVQELEAKGGHVHNAFDVTLAKAMELSKTWEVPMHPKYIFPYNDISADDVKALVKWLATERANGPEKRLLEELYVPHHLDSGKVVLDGEEGEALLITLNVPESAGTVDCIEATSALELVNRLSPHEIREWAPLYVGARMGRPEKAKERLMTPAPHVLFPVGNYGGAIRSVVKAAEKGGISVDIRRNKCESCGTITPYSKCPNCGGKTCLSTTCHKCGRECEGECPACHFRASGYESRVIGLKDMLADAIEKVGKPDPKFKGVKGLMNKDKTCEPLEKGILRSRHQVFIFKDGTIRVDSTNLPLTHFRPNEIGTTVETLKSLGYTMDAKGDDLTSDDQVVELFPQDIVPSAEVADYLFRATKFVDEELEALYGQEAFYKCNTPSDMVGQLVIGLAPHTSAGVVGRIIGFSQARGCYQHPLWVACSRRDCDGDENAVMLLLDALVNFSMHYLPSSRGGKMDASLVLTMGLKPLEVDDQVHEMDVCGKYPLEFYRTSHELKKPSAYRGMVEVLMDRLNNEDQYDSWGYTIDTTKIDSGVTQSAYTKLGAMTEKVGAQLGLGKKIRAVDEKDEAERLLNCHFFRDIYGNLRAFGEQKFRCVDCNAKYRRTPLVGKCTKCGGRIILTIAEGSVRKYLEISKSIARDYGLSDYVLQRLKLVGNNIDSVFLNDKSKQYSLSDFI